jgi:hypothetical protein
LLTVSVSAVTTNDLKVIQVKPETNRDAIADLIKKFWFPPPSQTDQLASAKYTKDEQNEKSLLVTTTSNNPGFDQACTAALDRYMATSDLTEVEIICKSNSTKLVPVFNALSFPIRIGQALILRALDLVPFFPI